MEVTGNPGASAMRWTASRRAGSAAGGDAQAPQLGSKAKAKALGKAGHLGRRHHLASGAAQHHHMGVVDREVLPLSFSVSRASVDPRLSGRRLGEENRGLSEVPLFLLVLKRSYVGNRRSAASIGVVVRRQIEPQRV